MLDQIDRALDRWVDAGIIDPNQAEAIRDLESQQGVADGDAPAEAPAEGPPPPPPPAPSTPATDRSARDRRRVDLSEALAYVGVALALGAGLVVLADVWQELTAPVRAGVVTATAVALGGASWSLWGQDEGPGHRLATLLAASATAALSGAVALWAVALGDPDDVVVALLAGATALAAGVPVHRLRPSWPTTLVLAGGVLSTVFPALDLALLQLDDTVVGVVLVGIGLAWAAAGWSGLARPRSAFEVTGLLAGGAGAQALAADDATTWFGIGIALVVALGTVLVGVTEQRTTPTVIGGLGVVVFAPQAVLQVFGEDIGGPLALLVTGIALVVVAVLGLRTHRDEEVRS